MARPIKTANSPDCRATIRTIAQTLFAERGFAGTTIREIAEQAGVKSSLLYHYYSNKEALYLSLLEAAVSELGAQVERIAANTDTPETKIRQLVQAFFDHFQAKPEHFQLMQRAMGEYSPAAKSLAQCWLSRAFGALHAITAEGVKHGLFRPLPPHLLAFAIVGILVQTVHFHKVAEDISAHLSSEHLFDEEADLIVALLRSDTPRPCAPVHRSKKRLPGKKPRSNS